MGSSHGRPSTERFAFKPMAHLGRGEIAEVVLPFDEVLAVQELERHQGFGEVEHEPAQHQ